MKIVRNDYALEFRVLTIEMDAAYLYTPGMIDLVVIDKGFEEDNFLVAQFISFLQREIALKKKANKRNEPLIAHCLISDLDLDREPDFLIRNFDDMDEVGLPGDEIVLIGRAGPRKKKIPDGYVQPPPTDFESTYQKVEDLVDPEVRAMIEADKRKYGQDYEGRWDDDWQDDDAG